MKLSKKLTLTFLTAFIFTFFSIQSVFATFATYIPFDGSEPNPTVIPTESPSQPKISVTSPLNHTFKAGETRTIKVTVKNIGTKYANSFIAQASSPESGITANITTNTNEIPYIYEGSSYTFDLKISADKSLKEGTYNVTLKYLYKNEIKENFESSDTLYIKITNPIEEANLYIDKAAVSKNVLMPGDTFDIAGILVNSGGKDAENVQITFDGLGSDRINLLNSDKTNFNTVKAGEKINLNYRFSIYNKLKEGTYPVVFKIQYKISDGTLKDYSYTQYINVSDGKSQSDKKAVVEIISAQAPQGVLNVGDLFTVNVTLQNNGKTDATNVKITAVVDKEGAVVPKSSNTKVIDKMPVGASERLSFSFSPTSLSKSQNYVINFNVTYETGFEKTDETMETLSVDQYVGVNVVNPKADKDEEDSKKISKPKIIIQSYECDPQIVKAGQNFNLKMVFQNTHKSKTIENIKATIAATEADNNPNDKKGNTFMPVDGSNTFYIDSIAPKATSSKDFVMFTIPDADPRTYTLTVKFKYQDADFNEYEEEEIIGITVKQVTKLDVGNIIVPETGMPGDIININFNLMNTGKSPLNNLTAKARGNFDDKNSMMYFGTLNKSASAYYDAEITLTEPGKQTGEIVITYEDEVGEVTEIVKEFAIDVMEMGAMPDGMMGSDQMGFGGPVAIGPDGMPMDMQMGMDGAMPPQGGIMRIVKNPWVIGGIVIVILIGAVVAVKIHNKRRKEKLADE